MDDQLSTVPAVMAGAPAGPHALTAQAIQCGAWSLALSFDWANTIVDQFEMVTIPKSPHWLIGAVNLEGGIVPVVDLAAYVDPTGKTTSIDRHHRLLVGGRTEGSNEDAVAILFSGLPFQIQYTREPLSTDVPMPERLRDLSRGTARSDTGKRHLEIDTHRFVENLSISLMEI